MTSMGEPPAITYPFDAGAAAEHRRLVDQSRLFNPITDRLLRNAGLRAGMRVLDLGSGAGDVSILASRIIGPSGMVTGLEMSADAIAFAERRVDAADIRNITFVKADVNSLESASPPSGTKFDAVIGRLVLVYMANPATVLRSAATLLRPGGIVCFEEIDLTYAWSYPSSPLWDQLRSWVEQASPQFGLDLRFGLRLHHHFRSAGLPRPQLRLEAAIGSETDGPIAFWAALFRAVAPLLDEIGVAKLADIAPETLEDRLRNEALDHEMVIVGPLLVGCWSTLAK